MSKRTPKHQTKKYDFEKWMSWTKASANHLFKTKWLPMMAHGLPLKILVTSSTGLILNKKMFSFRFIVNTLYT